MKKAVGKPNGDEFALQSSRGTAIAVDEESPLCAFPRVISEKALPAEARRATALGGRISRGRDVTFIWKVIAYHFVDPAAATPCGFAPYSLRNPFAHRPRVIYEKARRPKPEGRPPLAVGSRGGVGMLLSCGI